MLESSTLKYFNELAAVARLQKSILGRLKARFGEVPTDLIEKLNEQSNEEHLDALIDQAASCKDLEAFREAL